MAVEVEPKQQVRKRQSIGSPWPGADRRDPSPTDRHFLVLAPLARQLSEQIDRRFAGRDDVRVLDIGCGVKPYLPLFARYAASYRGLDVVPGPYVDDVGEVEALPYTDGQFDVVLCTQVLEHVDDPPRAVREIHRVLARGGTALASTHGVALYHPDPPPDGRDLWRWTHSGLRELFARVGPWDALEVEANGNAVACIGYIAAQYADEALSRGAPAFIRRAAIYSLNRVAAALDRRYPPRARVPRAGSLAPNYLVVAVKR